MAERQEMTPTETLAKVRDALEKSLTFVDAYSFEYADIQNHAEEIKPDITQALTLLTALEQTGEVNIPMEAHRVIRAAIGVVNADTYCHPMLSREDAVKAGVSELHDAVGAYRQAFHMGQASAQPPKPEGE